MFFRRKFSFWLSIISIIICLSDYLGVGIANIILVRLNPIIDTLIFTEPFESFMVDVNNPRWETNSALISVRFPTYIIHFGTFLILGILMDYLIRIIKQK
ncbi:hypothetical protein BJP49_27045 [Paenibacillus odorifer]|uniref:Uncharacterized protein n=1 Tax=Paenibacillus odorifer TaxID=189426 RepID=A0A1R0YRJ8_9BACL|nr:hypothetical protein CD191_11340 [Paenibacillus odorifer]OMC96993.1 hypothetical protein BJP46_26905 [Paenibacillus odorifer]OMD02039.1 hypothetical protein BJP49_27045 [Paenibacillus odorifer]OMD24663.1 hypothetical protein BJP48_24960 [Paenibacillus odorifer]OME08813.1 hypothetical protein BSK60_29095 [Paenibacillus odorifer]